MTCSVGNEETMDICVYIYIYTERWKGYLNDTLGEQLP